MTPYIIWTLLDTKDTLSQGNMGNFDDADVLEKKKKSIPAKTV
jgi:hypothetical protein